MRQDCCLLLIHDRADTCLVLLVLVKDKTCRAMLLGARLRACLRSLSEVFQVQFTTEDGSDLAPQPSVCANTARTQTSVTSTVRRRVDISWNDREYYRSRVIHMSFTMSLTSLMSDFVVTPSTLQDS